MSTSNPNEPRQTPPNVLARQMPHNSEAEQSLLSSMMNDPATIIPLYLKHTRGGEFYEHRHETIATALAEMYGRGAPVDLITLTQEMRDRRKLDAVGGPAYLTGLLHFTPTTSEAEHHLLLLQNLAAKRQIIQVASALAFDAYEPGMDLNELDDRVHALAADRAKVASTGTTVRTAKQRMELAMERLEARHEGKGKLRGIGSGNGALDRKTGGWQGGQMIVIGAATKGGKSSLARQFVEHAAVVEKRTVAIFSHEMGQEEVDDCMIASLARVDLQRLDSGTISEAEFNRIGHAVGKLADTKTFVFDEAHVTLPQYRANLRRAVQEFGAELIVVDYLQLVAGQGDETSREREVASVSRTTKLMAKELNVPIVILCQLNDQNDPRESRAIKMDLDKFIVIEHEDPEAEGDGKAWLNVKLQRGGAKGKVPVMWRPAITRFDALAPETTQPPSR